MATLYRLVSWFFSLVFSVGIVAVVGIIANHFFGASTTAGAEFGALAVILASWVRVWRRYHAPLFNLIPRGHYQRFVRSRPERERFRAPLFHFMRKAEYDRFVEWRASRSAREK